MCLAFSVCGLCMYSYREIHEKHPGTWLFPHATSQKPYTDFTLANTAACPPATAHATPTRTRARQIRLNDKGYTRQRTNKTFPAEPHDPDQTLRMRTIETGAAV